MTAEDTTTAGQRASDAGSARAVGAAGDAGAPSFQTIRYEVLEPGDHGIATVTLDRPESRNAQNKRMTYELNAAFDDASRRSDVKVIVLQADGPHFSSGHDMRDKESMKQFDVVGPYGGFGREGQEGQMAWEEEVYFQMCWRWRNLPKPVIAAAQGKTIAGGLMLLWVADVIIAADDALFSDPVVAMGVNGVEYFGHPWELGAAQGQGAAVHRRLGDRGGGPPAGHGEPRRAGGRAAPVHHGDGPPASRSGRASP